MTRVRSRLPLILAYVIVIVAGIGLACALTPSLFDSTPLAQQPPGSLRPVP